MHSAYACKRYFVYHHENGTSDYFTDLEKQFISGVQFYYPDGIEDWNYYVSANPEKISWDMTVSGVKYKGLWNKDKTHLVWRIPNGATEKFEQHIFFKHRRIIKGDD